MSDRLNRALDRPPTDLSRLHARLVEEADRAGLIALAYLRIDSPVGPLLLVASEHGLVRVAFERENHDAVLDRLAQLVSPRVLAAPAQLAPAARQLSEYFAGARRTFELDLDLRLSHGFRREVVSQLQGIGYGATATYAEIARATGRPTAVRAVGTACATNPLPIVIPCHRVRRSDGGLGGYLGGTAAKQRLLELESA